MTLIISVGKYAIPVSSSEYNLHVQQFDLLASLLARKPCMTYYIWP